MQYKNSKSLESGIDNSSTQISNFSLRLLFVTNFLQQNFPSRHCGEYPLSLKDIQKTLPVVTLKKILLNIYKLSNYLSQVNQSYNNCKWRQIVTGKIKYQMYIRSSFYLQIMVSSLYLIRCLKQYFPLFLIFLLHFLVKKTRKKISSL